MPDDPSKTSACSLPARLSLLIFSATSPTVWREYCTVTPGYFFMNASATGRTSWFTISVEYQTTLPSFCATAISAGSAAARRGRLPASGKASALPMAALRVSPVCMDVVLPEFSPPCGGVADPIPHSRTA